MAIVGWKNDSSRPAGRKAFGENVHAPSTARSETIRPHFYDDGQLVAGTPAGNVHGVNKTRYLDPAAKAHRAELRGNPTPKSNETVHSKATKRHGVNPTSGDVHGSTGEQPAKIHGRDLPSGIFATPANPPGKHKPEVVGHVPNSGGKWKDASHKNTHRTDPANIHNAPSVPSGRTITK